MYIHSRHNTHTLDNQMDFATDTGTDQTRMLDSTTTEK